MNISLSQPSKRIARIIGIIVIALSIIIHVAIFYGLLQTTFNFASQRIDHKGSRARVAAPLQQVILFKADEAKKAVDSETPAALTPSKTPFGNTPLDVTANPDEIPTQLVPLDDIHGVPQTNLTLPATPAEKTTSVAAESTPTKAGSVPHATIVGEVIKGATMGEKSALKADADPHQLVSINQLPTGRLDSEEPGNPDAAKKKPKRNLFALTKGFIENLQTKENGTDALERDGDRTKRPSFEELKYISYHERVCWQLQSAWKQIMRVRPVALPVRDGTKLVVQYSLDAKGYLLSAKVVESTGYKFVDDRVLEAFSKGSPYPPIPKHFNVAQYHTTTMISIGTEKLTW